MRKMRKTLLTTILMISIFGLFALAASAQRSPSADLTVSGIASGTPYETVIKILGKPQRGVAEDEIDQCTQGLGNTLFYDGFTISMMGDENGKKQTVLDMEITSSKWVTDKGIKIGSTAKQVMAKYGKTKYEDAFERPTEEKVFTGEKWLVYNMKTNGPGGLTFFFKNDRLVRIELKATTC